MTDVDTDRKPRRWRSIGLKCAGTLLAVFIWAAIPIGLLMLGSTIFASSSVPAMLGNSRSVYTQSWDDFGYVLARGTWVMDNDDIASPLNEVRIGCYRDMGECFVATAELMPMSTSTRPLLVADLARFPITRWDRDIIIFSEANDCVVYSVTINRVTESVTARREPDPNRYEGACVVPLDGVVLTSLQDGHQVFGDLLREDERNQSPWIWFALGAWSLYMLWRLFRMWRRKINP